MFFFFYVLKIFLKKIEIFLFFYFFQINIFLVFLGYFDALISKIIFKKQKKSFWYIFKWKAF